MRRILLVSAALLASSCSLLDNADSVKRPRELASLEVTPASPSVAKGLTLQLTATAHYSDGSAADVTAAASWSSSAPDIASVSDATGTRGFVTAVAEGTATVIAALGGKSGNTSVTVAPPAVTSIAVSPAVVTIANGTSTRFYATATYSDATTRDVSILAAWASTAPGVATVLKGLATAKSGGTTTLTATYSGQSGSATLNVSQATLSVLSVGPATSQIATGTTVQLAATGTFSDLSTQDLTASVTWSSSGSAATLSVTAPGLVTGVSAGAATITASLLGKTASANVTVTAATLSMLSVTPATATAAKGTQVAFQAMGSYSDGSTQDLTSLVGWTSSAPAVASVAGGVAHALAAGTTTLTASFQGHTATAQLDVTDATLVLVEVAPDPFSLPKGGSQPLTATATFSDSTTQDVTALAVWSSSAASIASVSNAPGSRGVVTGVAQGAANVTAAYGGQVGTAAATVTAPAVTAIAVQPATPSLPKGTTQQLGATATYTDGSTQDVTATATWTSSAPSVATVSDAGATKGLVTAAGQGTATITAALGGKSGTSSVTVTAAAITSIAVAPASPTLPKGVTQQLTATATYTDASTADVTAQATWTSSAPGIATVSDVVGTRGLVTAASQGSATVTAALGGKNGTSSVTVVAAAVASIAVAPNAPSLPKGTTQQLTATATYTDATTQDVTALATWTSDTTATATVSDVAGTKGLVTAVAQGSATVTAAYSGKSGTSNVTVTAPAVVSIAVTPNAPSLPKGTTQQLTAMATYTDGSVVDVASQATWTSDASAIASVSDAAGTKGLVTGAAQGSATITASFSGKSGTSNVTVTPAALVSLAVTPASASLAKGLTQQLAAKGTYTDGTLQDVTAQATWTSSASSAATVSDVAGTKGLVTAVAQGSANVTAALSGKTSNAAAITVTPAQLVSIAVAPSSLSIPLGTHRQLTATGTYTDASTQDLTASVTWSSSNATAATVSNGVADKGVLRTLAQGGATVTAAFSGLSGTCGVTVGPVALVAIDLGPALSLPLTSNPEWLPANGIYSDGGTTQLGSVATWSSSNTAVATVSNSAGARGTLQTVGAGTTTVTATFGGITGTVNLAVHAPVMIWVAAFPDVAEVPVNGQLSLLAKALYDDWTVADVTASATWTTSDGTVATVSGGVVQGKGVGAATLTAAAGGVSGSTVVLVTTATLQSVFISPPNPTMQLGWDFGLVAVAEYSDGSVFDVSHGTTWRSSDPFVATIDWEGRVTGVKAGSITATASYGGALPATTTVTVVSPPPYAYWLEISSVPNMPVGTTLQLRAVAHLGDGTTQDVTSLATWTSADPTVAAFKPTSPAGFLTAIAPGWSNLTATWQGTPGWSWVSVPPAGVTVTGVTVTPSTLTAPLNASGQLNATATYSNGSSSDVTGVATWTTSNGAAVTLSAAAPGVISAVGGGTATVTAVVFGRSGTSTVTVETSPVASISVSPATAAQAAGVEQVFTATATLQDSTSLDITPFATWSSTDWSAYFSAPGRVRGSRQGTTTLISAAFGTALGIATLDILAPVVTSVWVNSPVYTYYLGTTGAMSAQAQLSDGNWEDVTALATWTSGTTGVATVSDAAGTKGIVTPVSAGYAGITASYDGFSQTSTIQVQALSLASGPGAVSITPASPISLKIGGSTYAQLIGNVACSVPPCPTVDLTALASWGSSNPSVATVGQAGLLSGLMAGTATITATYQPPGSPAPAPVAAQATVNVGTPVVNAISVFRPFYIGMGCVAGGGSIGNLPTAVDVPLIACAQLDNGLTYDVTSLATWQSDTPALVSVSDSAGSKGALTTAAAGAASITVTFGTFSQSVPFTVTSDTLVFLQIQPDIMLVPTGVFLQMNGNALYTDGSSYDVTGFTRWSTDDVAVATVAPDPQQPSERVNGVAPGATLLRVNYGALNTDKTVNVDGRAFTALQTMPTSLSSPTMPTMPTSLSASIPVGQRTGVIVYATDAVGRTWDVTELATWTSSNTAAATVSNTAGSRGQVTAAAPGFTTIQASLGGLVASSDLEVNGATLTGLTLDRAYDAEPVGMGVSFWANATYSDGRQYDGTPLATWTATPNTIAVAGAAPGKFKVVGSGSATVQATFGGKSASARLVGF